MTQLEAILALGGELPVTLRSGPLSINTSQATYPLIQKSISAEWKRSAEEVMGAEPQEANSTHLMRKVGGESGKSGRFCNWNVQHHPVPSDDELRACILIWGILIVCLIIIFLMFLYFSLAVYLAMRKQVYFEKLHSTCSVSSIYSRQFYRLRRSIFRRNRQRGNKFGWERSVELLHFSDDSSNASGSEEEGTRFEILKIQETK